MSFCSSCLPRFPHSLWLTPPPPAHRKQAAAFQHKALSPGYLFILQSLLMQFRPAPMSGYVKWKYLLWLCSNGRQATDIHRTRMWLLNFPSAGHVQQTANIKLYLNKIKIIFITATPIICIGVHYCCSFLPGKLCVCLHPGPSSQSVSLLRPRKYISKIKLFVQNKL